MFFLTRNGKKGRTYTTSQLIATLSSVSFHKIDTFCFCIPIAMTVASQLICSSWKHLPFSDAYFDSHRRQICRGEANQSRHRWKVNDCNSHREELPHDAVQGEIRSQEVVQRKAAIDAKAFTEAETHESSCESHCWCWVDCINDLKSIAQTLWNSPKRAYLEEVIPMQYRSIALG